MRNVLDSYWQFEKKFRGKFEQYLKDMNKIYGDLKGNTWKYEVKNLEDCEENEKILENIKNM